MRWCPVSTSPSTHEELLELLGGCPPFDSMASDERVVAARAGEFLDFGPGEVVVDAFAEESSDVYIVVSGVVNVWFDAERIAEGPADRFRSGAVFGFASARIVKQRAVAARRLGPGHRQSPS